MKPKIFTYLLLAAVMFAAGSITSTSHAATLAGPPDEGYAQQVLPTIAVDTPAYKYLRQEYDFRGYIASPADRYNVAQLTFLSALVPGAGQMVAREYGKGALFFAGTYSLFSTSAFLYLTLISKCIVFLGGKHLRGIRRSRPRHLDLEHHRRQPYRKGQKLVPSRPSRRPMSGQCEYLLPALTERHPRQQQLPSRRGSRHEAELLALP